MCVLVDSEYLFQYLFKVHFIVPYVSYDIILFYFWTCDLHDLWIHIRIVKGVFKNTSRGFEVLQIWARSHQPRPCVLTSAAQDGGPHAGGCAAPLLHSPLWPRPLNLLCDCQLHSGEAKTLRFYFKKEEKDGKLTEYSDESSEEYFCRFNI